MLGEPVGETRGKITGTRVLPLEGQAPKVEVSFETTGKLLGIDVVEIGTYWSTPLPEGFWFGEGQGVLTTKDGEMVTWRGQGAGKPTGKGLGARWRGAFCHTSSRNLARLNGIAVVFEHDVDDKGNTQTKLWEWK
jgi:hypothetical protein